MDTMRYHKKRPLQSNIDISGASLQHVISQYDKLKHKLTVEDDNVFAYAEIDALWFYVQQHAMGLAERTLDSEEPLGDYESFVQGYHKSSQPKTLRMFYYILLICTRESRHAGGGIYDVYDKYPAIKSFHIDHVHDSSADSSIAAIINNAPDVTLGEYVDFLVDSFEPDVVEYDGGFGGKKWHEVATPLKQFVHGEISAEILMDTAFTLAHNGGPIFNKGMLYHSYNSSALKMILDVQRSGQIPQLIATHNTQSPIKSFIKPDLIQYVEDFGKLEAGFGGEVDWSLVKDIKGNVGYPTLAKLQEDHNSSTNIKQKLADMKEKALAKAKHLKAQAAKAALLKGSFELMPGIFVPKAKRSQK